MQQEQIQHLKCSHFSPPRSIWFTAASAVPAALLGCGGCGNGRAHGGRSHRRCRYAGAEERESAKRQREGLSCSCGGRCVNGCRYWKQRGGERRYAGSDAACRGRSECGVTVGEGGGQQGCTPLRNLRQPARGTLWGWKSGLVQKRSGDGMQSGSPVMRVEGLLMMGYGCGHGGRFPLRSAAAEVRNQADAERVAGVQTFHGAQIPRHFSQTLPKANAHEVHGQRMSIKISWKRQREVRL